MGYGKPENEWLSPRFWEVLGYSHKRKKAFSFSMARTNISRRFRKNILKISINMYEDSNYPYDQIVRYKHKKGHTVWIRCRNIIRDEKGKPLRMIGVHNDITIQKINEEKSNSKSNVC